MWGDTKRQYVAIVSTELKWVIEYISATNLYVMLFSYSNPGYIAPALLIKVGAFSYMYTVYCFN